MSTYPVRGVAAIATGTGNEAGSAVERKY